MPSHAAVDAARSAPVGEIPAAPAQDLEVDRIADWLIEQGLLRARFETIVAGFGERLVAAGVPLWRGYATITTLHPTIRGVGASWRPESGVQTEHYVHRLKPSEDYLQSPFRHMLESRTPRLRLRLEEGPTGFPLLDRFRGEGASDYLALLVGYGIDGTSDGRTGLAASWATARPGGFTAGELAILDRLAPSLALAIQARLGHDTAVNLLNTYVGPEAGRRILDGEIHRGSLQVIRAVIFYADLRGFTALADQSDREAMVELLNAYFDCLVPIVAEHRGQVLKFLGDGLLATFPLEDEDPAEVCARALDAAAEILVCLRDLNRERGLQQRPVMDLDMVLHLGEVVFGNVGSADRLDFTVIGPAVNEASRIEALCASVGRHLLVSEAFASAAVHSGDRLVGVGRFALRGVRAAQMIYALDGL
jgi:adenylate cyclase